MPRIPALPQPRSALGRAVAPVLGGLVLLAMIFGATWAIAAWISRGGAETTRRLAPTVLPVGDVTSVAASIEESGPLLFPGLNTTSGERTLVLDHTGEDPTSNWRLYWAYPADRDRSCAVSQIRNSDRFTDCDGREVAVTDLARPRGVCPIVEERQRLSINLAAVTATADDESIGPGCGVPTPAG